MVLGVQSPMSRFLRIVARNGLRCFTPFVNHSQTFEIKEIIKSIFVTSYFDILRVDQQSYSIWQAFCFEGWFSLTVAC